MVMFVCCHGDYVNLYSLLLLYVNVKHGKEEEKQPFQQMKMSNWISISKKKKLNLDLYLTPYIKINSKQAMDLN